MKKLKLLLPVSLLLLTAVLLSSCGHVHDIVIDPEVAPTCAATGKTEGAHCSSCGEVIVKQKEIPMVAHNIEKTGCTTCDLKASEGLAYEVKNGWSYVTLGTCTDEIVFVPQYDSDGNQVISVDFSSSNTTKVKKIVFLDGSESFIVEVTAPDVEIIELPESIMHMDMIRTFSNCKNLKSIEIPEGCVSIALSTFNGCSSLENVILHNYLHEIGPSAFKDCESLKEITIPKYIRKIEENTFYGCSSLEKITLPVEIRHIGDYAFSECTSLVEFNMPYYPDYLGDGIFSKCYQLERIYSDLDMEDFISHHKLNINKYGKWYDGLLGSVKIVCTDGEITISEYKQMINQTPED